MPNEITCPNPSCKQVFPQPPGVDPTTIRCPKCGSNCRLKKAAPPPLPSKPAAPPSVPAAEQPPPPPAPDLAFDDGPVIRRRPRRRSDFVWLRVLGVFVVIAACAGGVLYYFRDDLAHLLQVSSTASREFRQKGNFAFRAARGWQPDEALREKTRAALALSHDQPRGFMVMHFLDHPQRAFSDAQLLDRALRHLRAYFPRMEYEDPFGGESDGRSDKLGGEPAVVFNFSATDASEVPVRGQAYILSRQGFSYWMLFWAPEDNYDELADKWQALRAGFRLYNEREGWKPRPRETATFAGSAMSYRLRYPRDIWKANDHPKGADPACEVFLQGQEPEEDESTGRKRGAGNSLGVAAEVMLLVLPKADDEKSAAAAAMNHVKKQWAETHPMLKVEPLPERGKGRAGAMMTRIDRFRVLHDPGNERFVLIAVASQPDGLLALVAECRWDRKDYWEQEFRALAEAAQPGSAEAKPGGS